MAYKSMRDYIEAMEKDGELKRISGADWNLEMASIAELVYREGKRPAPAMLFDDIPGYPRGFRTLFGFISSPRRMSRALSVPASDNAMEVVGSLRTKRRDQRLIAPRVVSSGAVLENKQSGADVDLTIFPTPRFHELDGGRYIGTGHAVVQRDPDTGYVNLGTYRSMLVDRSRLTIHSLEGQHGSIIANKYLSQGKPMPVAIVMGGPPVVYFVSTDRGVPWGVSEYDVAGGIAGEPLEVIEAPYTGLPVPAHAEIVIEGECIAGDVVDEGPFGEWTGYYGNFGLEKVPEPVVRVKNILYRNDPILTCAGPAVPPSELSLWFCIQRAAMFWEGLERMGIPGIKGVWCHEEGGSLLFTVVSIKQMYAGHSNRVGLVASQITTINRFTVVVDDDIDPANLSDVMWAVASRVDPQKDILVLPHCGTSSADTTVSIEEKRKTKVTPKPLYSSRAIIDACQPFESKNEWYPVAKVSPELRSQVMGKWASLFKELG